MTRKHLSAVLVVALTLVFCLPAEAQTSSGKIGGIGTGTVVGIIVGVAVAVAVVAIVVVHHSKKRTITGCVNSAGSGTTVTDEKDKQVYALSADSVSLPPGNRVRLEGKQIRSKGSDKTLVWEARKVTKNYGVCRP